MKQPKKWSGNLSRFMGSKALICAAALSFIAAANKAGAQTAIFTDGFEGVTVSSSTANGGGATGNTNLNIAGTTWSSTGSLTTFTGNAPTAGTSLALSNSSATTQTWTLNVPMGSAGLLDSISKITYQYRGTSTSYNFLTVKVNGTTVSAGSLNINSAFQSVTTTFAPIVSSTVTVQFVFSGGTHGSGGTMRLDNVNLFGGVYNGTSGCIGTPSSAGSISVGGGITAFCGTGAVTLSLVGGTTGGGIHYQWEQLVGGTYVPTGAGDTLSTYNTGSLSATTSFKVKTTCLTSGGNIETAPATITINSLPANSAISSIPNPAIIGSTYTLTDATTGGFWSSANTNIATIDGSGVLTPVYGGTATISYVTDNGTCQNLQTATVNVAWPNTLALYAGANGTSTATIPGYTTETVSNLSYTSSLAATCTSGGFSGMTVPTAVTTFSAAGPHVFYKIKPTMGNALNVFRIAAKTRESGTGPTKAKIAFSLDGGATWAAQSGEEILNTGGGCGTNGNSWSLDSAVNGITDSILVAVFPYAPGASTGTFQVNTLEVYGSVTTAANCVGTPAAGFITPTAVYLCDSGSRFLSLDSGLFTGAAGVGISYQWNMNGVAIPGATNISYNTGELHAPAVVYYTVTTTCKNGATILGAATSNIDTVNVNATPTAGIISGLPTYDGHGKYTELVVPGTLSTTGATAGGVITWSTNDSSSTMIDHNTGDYVSVLPGVSVITALNTVAGCTGRTRDTIFAVEPNTIAAYTGLNGTSTGVINFKPATITVTPLAQTGYGVATPCGFGGLSGMTNNGVTGYSFTGAHAYYQMNNISVNPLTIDGFHATVRSSASGLQTLRMAYSTDGGASWIDDGIDQAIEFDDCGYSTVDKAFGGTLPVVAAGSNIQFGLFAYAPIAAGGTFQVNALDVTSPDAPSLARHTNTGVAAIAPATTSVDIYPNPASTVLNIAAANQVNAVVMGLDGKVIISQNDVHTLNISNLANGMYFIKVYDANNMLIKTAKFTKK